MSSTFFLGIRQSYANLSQFRPKTLTQFALIPRLLLISHNPVIYIADVCYVKPGYRGAKKKNEITGILVCREVPG